MGRLFDERTLAITINIKTARPSPAGSFFIVIKFYKMKNSQIPNLKSDLQTANSALKKTGRIEIFVRSFRKEIGFTKLALNLPNFCLETKTSVQCVRLNLRAELFAAARAFRLR